MRGPSPGVCGARAIPATVPRPAAARTEGRKQKPASAGCMPPKPDTRIGAPGRIRTPGTGFRKPLLYPPELRAQSSFSRTASLTVGAQHRRRAASPHHKGMVARATAGRNGHPGRRGEYPRPPAWCESSRPRRRKLPESSVCWQAGQGVEHEARNPQRAPLCQSRSRVRCAWSALHIVPLTWRRGARRPLPVNAPHPRRPAGQDSG